VRTPCCSNFSFDRILSKASCFLQLLRPCKHAAFFQKLLELSVLAKSSVQRNECEIDISGELEILVSNIDINDIYAERTQCLAIPCPVASETSRSLLGPPIKTAIFLGNVFISSGSPRFALPFPIQYRALSAPLP